MLALPGICLSSWWSPPFRSDPPHDLVGTLDRRSVAVSLGKGGVLANCSLCGTKATLSFSAGPVCSSFSAEACTLYAGLGSTNNSASSLLLLSDSRPVFSYLKLCGRSVFSQATMSPRTLVSPEERRG